MGIVNKIADHEGLISPSFCFRMCPL